MSYYVEQQEKRALIKDLAGTVVAEVHDTSAGREFVKFVVWACDEKEVTIRRDDLAGLEGAVYKAFFATSNVRHAMAELSCEDDLTELKRAVAKAVFEIDRARNELALL